MSRPSTRCASTHELRKRCSLVSCSRLLALPLVLCEGLGRERLCRFARGGTARRCRHARYRRRLATGAWSAGDCSGVGEGEGDAGPSMPTANTRAGDGGGGGGCVRTRTSLRVSAQAQWQRRWGVDGDDEGVGSLGQAEWRGEAGSGAETASSAVDVPVAATRIVIQRLWLRRLVASWVL